MENKNQKVDSPIDSTPPPTQSQAVYPAPISTIPANDNKSHKRRLLLLLTALLLVCALGGVYLYYIGSEAKTDVNEQQGKTPTSSKTTPGVKSSSESQPTAEEPATVLTYVSTGNPKTFMVTDASNKTLAKLSINAPDNTATVMAKGPSAMLVDLTYMKNTFATATDIKPYLVSYDGKVLPLPVNVSSVIKSYGRQYMLSNNNTLYYVSCNQQTRQCSLNGINMTTGAETTLVTQAGAPDDAGVGPSIGMIGISNNIMYYGSSTGSGPSSSYAIISYNLSTKRQVNSYTMPGVPSSIPVISHDKTRAIFSDQSVYGRRYIIDLTNGNVKTYSSTTGADNADYVWSLNDQYIAFTTPLPGATSAKPPETINIMDADTGKVSVLKTFGDPRYNSVILLPWLTNDELYYGLSTTASPNYFENAPLYKVINISSGVSVAHSLPSGYTYDLSSDSSSVTNY